MSPYDDRRMPMICVYLFESIRRRFVLPMMNPLQSERKGEISKTKTDGIYEEESYRTNIKSVGQMFILLLLVVVFFSHLVTLFIVR